MTNQLYGNFIERQKEDFLSSFANINIPLLPTHDFTIIPKYMCACTNFTSDYYKLLLFVVCKKVPTP